MITAGYDSRCPGCDGQIHDGDSIGRVAGEWCCEECVTDMGEDDDGASHEH